MVDLGYYLINLLFSNIPLLYYCIGSSIDQLRSSIICCLFCGNKHLSLGISSSSALFFVSFATVPELFCGKVLKTFVILSAVLLSIKSPVAFAIF